MPRHSFCTTHISQRIRPTPVPAASDPAVVTHKPPLAPAFSTPSMSKGIEIGHLAYRGIARLADVRRCYLCYTVER